MRRDALVAALGEHLPSWELAAVPAGGLHVWVRLPDGHRRRRADRPRGGGRRARLPRPPWFAAEPPAPHLRLTFAGAPAAELAEGVRRLAGVA